jgi:carboxypeptidase Taq
VTRSNSGAYAALEARFSRIAAFENALGILHAAFENALGILHWDQATMMPPGSAVARGDTLAEIGTFIHELVSAPIVAEQLEAARESGELTDWQQANLREISRRHLHTSALPADFTARKARTTIACEMAWREARPANDFASLVPLLDESFSLVREAAAIKSERLGVTPYESLLDEFDSGRTEKEIDRLFGEIEAKLPSLLDQVVDRQASGPAAQMPDGPFPESRQDALCKRVARLIGFPENAGRLDASHHPFCGGADHDIRITTRYDEGDFTKALMAVIHETGHALYEHGRPAEWIRQPVGQAQGMTLHESQSLLLEMQAARSSGFLGYIAPIVREELGGDGPQWSDEALIRLTRRVSRGLIRVDADEVSYPLHVILRYRLEKQLLANEIPTRELPDAWHAMMENLLGITPHDDRDGVMQDIHWYEGMFGYFPTYLLGAMAAAQLYAAALDAVPGIPNALGNGDVAPLFGWLDANVRSRGSLHEPDDLLISATGKPLQSTWLLCHLENRYARD